MKGKCEDFCPAREVKMRIQERLVHFFEYKNPQTKTPGVLVKEFARSAAGVKRCNPQDLRTERCLKNTLEYLMKEILIDKRKAYVVVYDYIFDRLRAIRQEIVIQDFTSVPTIDLLEPMIMFLAFSRYRLCEDLSNFDPKICDEHLQECIKRTLTCYDEINCSKLNVTKLKRRSFIEALYLIFNLGSFEPLKRAIELPREIQEDETFNIAYQISMDLNIGNLSRALKNVRNLPHILCAIAMVKLQKIRRQFLLILAHGYSSKQLLVPLGFVAKLTLLDQSELIKQCNHYNIQISDDRKNVKFLKTDFKTDQAIYPLQRENFIEEKLKTIYLPEVILLKKF